MMHTYPDVPNENPRYGPVVLPESIRTYHERIADKDTWQLRFQGKLLQLRHKTGKARGYVRENIDKSIKTFSAKSRLNMLRWIARVEWDTIGCGLLVTLTYPSLESAAGRKRRAIHRQLFARAIEHLTGKPMPGFWRIEYLPRKSGGDKGKIVGHVHMVLMGIPWIHRDDVNRLWKRAIGHDGYCRTETKAAKNGELASFYVAKYCAKTNPSYSLVNVPQHNKDGRHWGMLRKDSMTLAPELFVDGLDDAQVARLVLAASGKLHWLDPTKPEGFTLLGDYAVDVATNVSPFGIDMGTPCS